MYLVEGTQELLVYYKLAVGDVLIFARLPSAQIIVCGRKGTEDETKKTSKKPAKKAPVPKPKAKGTKRTASAEKKKSLEDGGTAKTSPSTGAGGTSALDSGAVSGGDGAKSKRTTTAEGTSPGAGPSTSKLKGATAGKLVAVKSKKSRQEKKPSKKEREGVNSMYEYWSGVSLPARKDGVFRAVPAAAEVVPNKVTAQQGHWTAVVNLGGELYQAFFDSRDAAVAAYNAAVQG